jgi:hypothetical protein
MATHMPLRPLAILAVSSTMLSAGTVAKAATASDLDAAFRATFGQPAPVTSHVERPLYDIDQAAKVAGHLSQEMELTPDRLVPIDGSLVALIIKERVKNPGYANQGAIAVSYLHHSGGRWTLEHLWPEIAYSGVFGEPANAGAEVHRFGSAPLYLATGEWCGMGECSDSISAISLAPSGPHFLGEMMGGAWYPAMGVPPSDEEWLFSDACETYGYTAEIGPPTTATGVFSVTYDGWTAPREGTHTEGSLPSQGRCRSEWQRPRIAPGNPSP